MSQLVENIQILRRLTGAKIKDCKQALEETQGDLDSAKEWLRKNNISVGMARLGADARLSAEGVIAMSVKDHEGILIEVNCGTDFVARNENFQTFAQNLLQAAWTLPQGSSVEDLQKVPYDNTVSVAEKTAEMMGLLGETLQIHRLGRLSAPKGVVVPYIHNALDGNKGQMGKIGVLVTLESSDANADTAELKEALKVLGRKVAMHIACANPDYIKAEDVPVGIAQEEKERLMAQAKETGVSESVINQVVEGRLKKLLSEKILLDQKFALGGSDTIQTLLEASAKEAGVSGVIVTGFLRYALPTA